jgi:HSP20 family protein
MPRSYPFDSSPFVDFERLFERMGRQFDEMSRQFDTSGAYAGTHDISIDIADRDEEIVVTADLPGFEKSDIDVSVSGRQMTIHASHDVEHESEGDAYLRRERRHESVRRSFPLPVDVDEDAASASYRNGVLTVTLPKISVEDDDARHIDID